MQNQKLCFKLIEEQSHSLAKQQTSSVNYLNTKFLKIVQYAFFDYHCFSGILFIQNK